MATIIVIGNVTADLELKTTDKGSYANFSIAENNYVKGNQETTYYQCMAYGNIAERIVNAKVKKGSSLQILGRHELSVYEKKDGAIGHSIKIHITDWSYTPIGKKSETSNEFKSKDENQSFSETNVSEDDDLPF